MTVSATTAIVAAVAMVMVMVIEVARMDVGVQHVRWYGIAPCSINMTTEKHTLHCVRRINWQQRPMMSVHGKYTIRGLGLLTPEPVTHTW